MRKHFHELGRKIVALRRERGIAQIDLANAIGLAQSTLSHYEMGEREIRTYTLLKLAEFFDVSVEYLVGKTDCRLTARSYNGNGKFYELLDKLSSENRDMVYNQVVMMLGEK